MNPMRRILLAGGACLLALAFTVRPLAADPEGATSLSLQDALKISLENNYDIQVQKVYLQQSDMNLKGSYGIFDPLLTGGWYTQINRQPATSLLQTGSLTSLAMSRADGFTAGINQFLSWGQTLSLTLNQAKGSSNSSYLVLNPNYTTSAQVGTTFPLLQGFGKKVASVSVLRAKIDRDSANQQFYQGIRDALVQAEGDYWYLVYSIKDLEVREKALELAKRFQEETRKRIEVGVLAPIEQVTADAQVATREQEIIVAQQAVGDREDILKLALGYSKESPEWDRTIRPTDEPAVSTTEKGEAELEKTALEKRPEIAQAQYQVEKDKLNTNLAKNQTLPQLNLDASVTYNGAAGLIVDPNTGMLLTDYGYGRAWSQVSGLEYKSYYVGLSFKYPILNRAAKYQFQTVRLAQNADEITLEKLKLSVLNEVRAAVRNLEAAQKRVAAAQVTVRLQKEKLEAEQKKYDNGLSTAFNVLSYQNDLLSAASALLNAQVTAQVAGAQLDRAAGTYLEKKGVVIDGLDTAAPAAAAQAKS